MLSSGLFFCCLFVCFLHSRLKGQADWPFTQMTNSARGKTEPLRMRARQFSCRKLPSWGTFEGYCGPGLFLGALVMNITLAGSWHVLLQSQLLLPSRAGPRLLRACRWNQDTSGVQAWQGSVLWWLPLLPNKVEVATWKSHGRKWVPCGRALLEMVPEDME